MKKEIPKAYNPQEVEDGIYQKWEESGMFDPDNLPWSEDLKNDKENRFVISMPPPNATGVLHLGHASMLAYQDLLVRYNRMQGKNVLWLPGTDHASIATQTKVEKIIAEKGQTKYDLGREKFLERVGEFVENSQNTIKNQTRKMGSSCDWSRERYTLDDGLSRVVRKVFAKMYNDDLIYRGDRIVNWCPRCESTLADDEVEHKDQKANLYYFKYQKDFPITIATTRPETKLGDTAVALNPKDKRYQKYIGQVFGIDLGNGVHKIKIIADREVEMEFGTGALGVTPAHSMTDWEMAEKNDLEKIKIIGEDGKMNANAGKKYEGLTVLEAREKFVKYLEKNDLIEKVEEVDQALSVCYRCGALIEPLPSKQWFVAVDKKITIEGNQFFQNKSLKEVALEVVNKVDEKNEKKIEIIPERFAKTYHNWMENLHDWCISRQIWFGHRVPVWYKTVASSKYQVSSDEKSTAKQEIHVGTEKPKEKYEKAVLLHAWGSGPEEAFFPWLKKELEFRGIEVVVPSLPNPKNPGFTEWLEEFEKIKTNEKTIVVGRSLGATLALGAASRGKKFGNLVAVCTPLENPEIPDFFEQMGNLDFGKIKNNIKQYSVLHSSNDPYIKLEISEKLEKELGIEMVVVENADHFSSEEYKEILKACDVWIQDLDTLDTWFSSGLWTFSTLLEQDHEKYKTFEEWVANSPDLKKFHPTSVMETGYDILFFWIARMILMTTYAMDEIPFENVYLHGMIRDKQGRKMSKSLGNGIDPIEMIEKYGTDALRLSMIIGSSPGNDLKLYEEKIEGYRNFVNKLWNVSRYILMSVDDGFSSNSNPPNPPYQGGVPESKTLADKWILEHLENLKRHTTHSLKTYNFSFAFESELGIRDFMWDKFADWYLEVSKVQGKNDAILIYVLENLLKLCHPFIPFVTEQIWQEMGKEKLLMIEEWPKSKNYTELTKINVDFELLKGIVIEVRRVKNENGIPLREKVDVVINSETRKDLTQVDFDIIKENQNIIESLAGVKSLEFETGAEKSDGSIQFEARVIGFVNVGDLIDVEKEAERVEKEIQETEKYIRQIKGKLDNKQFVRNAPASIVKKEKEKLAESENKLKELKRKSV
ncbi:class I tRNA ligase family protein [Candidatus Parcubacteria bacterium]|nr:class I tRNA ligase family protein [Candidatus Parcubacteria bacterium]